MLTPNADWSFQSTQNDQQPGLINLGYGFPDPALLPTDVMTRACETAVRRFGPAMLEYGANAGPAPLLAMLRGHLAGMGEGEVAPGEIMITNGNSHALDLLTTLFTKPGDVVLVESPTYHLALRVLRDHPVELVAAPTDDAGVDVTQLAHLTQQLKHAGKRVSALYCVPTFNNPRGISVPLAQRQSLVNWAAKESVMIFEDDVYRELAYDGPAPPSLWSLAPRGTVARLGSFAKTLAPGLRLGFLTASETVVAQVADCGLIDSAGGVAHFAACCVAGLFDNGDYAHQVERLRQAYRSRRDALVGALQEHLSGGCNWRVPAGGFFVWVTLPAGMDSIVLLDRAREAGMAFVPGSKFFSDDSTTGTKHLRLAFTLYGEAQLKEAAKRLGQAIRGQ